MRGTISQAQRHFKTSKLVLEMNKAAAQLAKKAAAAMASATMKVSMQLTKYLLSVSQCKSREACRQR